MVGFGQEQIWALGLLNRQVRRIQNRRTQLAEKTMRYAIHFTDGSKVDCLTLEGAMRLIAGRHRVRRSELITDTTDEKISVWLYAHEISIAEVIVRA